MRVDGGQRRLIAVWFVAVLAVLGVLAVADRGAATVAERAISQGVNESGCTSGAIRTTLHGFPLLTQIARGRVDHVTLTLTGVSQGQVDLDSVVVDLFAVSTGSPRVAERAELAATVSVAAMKEMAGADWDVAVDSGAVVLTGIGVDGPPVQVRLVPRLTGDTLQFDLGGVRLLGTAVTGDQIPPEVVVAVSGLGSDLRGLPLGLEPESVAVGGTGLVVRAAGQAVRLDAAC